MELFDSHFVQFGHNYITCFSPENVSYNWPIMRSGKITTNIKQFHYMPHPALSLVPRLSPQKKKQGSPPSVCATYALWHLISDLIVLDTPTLWYAFTAYNSQLIRIFA